MPVFTLCAWGRRGLPCLGVVHRQGGSHQSALGNGRMLFGCRRMPPAVQFPKVLLFDASESIICRGPPAPQAASTCPASTWPAPPSCQTTPPSRRPRCATTSSSSSPPAQDPSSQLPAARPPPPNPALVVTELLAEAAPLAGVPCRRLQCGAASAPPPGSSPSRSRPHCRPGCSSQRSGQTR